jgi:hypothetical protein
MVHPAGAHRPVLRRSRSPIVPARTERSFGVGTDEVTALG